MFKTSKKITVGIVSADCLSGTALVSALDATEENITWPSVFTKEEPK